jgi:hypothetical protein
MFWQAEQENPVQSGLKAVETGLEVRPKDSIANLPATAECTSSVHPPMAIAGH